MGKQDALEGAKLAASGEPVKNKNGKELATELVIAARKALPDGVPSSSPYAKMSRDAMLGEAAKREIQIAPILQEEDLRMVMEHERAKMIGAPLATNPANSKPMDVSPPVPLQPPPPPRRKIRGLKESASGKWRVTNDKPFPVSVGGGQITTMRAGAIIERRHYTDQVMQGMVEQGLKLEPIEDSDDWE